MSDPSETEEPETTSAEIGKLCTKAPPVVYTSTNMTVPAPPRAAVPSPKRITAKLPGVNGAANAGAPAAQIKVTMESQRRNEVFIVCFSGETIRQVPARTRAGRPPTAAKIDRKSTRLNSSHLGISYA